MNAIPERVSRLRSTASRVKSLIGLLVVAVIPFGGARALAEVTVVVCETSYGNMPFTGGINRASDQPEGILDEVLQLATADLDVSIRKVYRPWNRCLHLLQSGAVDAMTGVGWNPERAKTMRFPDNKDEYLWRGYYPVFVKKHSALRWDGERFSHVDRKLSGPLGFQVTQRLKKLGVLAPGHIPPERAMVMIAHARLDGYVIEENIGWQYIDQLKLRDQLTVLPKRFMTIDWYMPVSMSFYSQRPDLVKTLWSSMKKHRLDRYSYFVKRYQLVEP